MVITGIKNSYGRLHFSKFRDLEKLRTPIKKREREKFRTLESLHFSMSLTIILLFCIYVNIYFFRSKQCAFVYFVLSIAYVYSTKVKSENTVKLKLLDESCLVCNQIFYPG